MSDIDLICGFDEVGVIEKGDSEDAEHYKMFGYASTPARDADEEQVIQKGLNLDPMLNGGWVNYDHDRSNIIGYPTLGEFRNHPRTGQSSLYVEYELLKGVPMAERVWGIAKALKANNAPRSLGLSIEGKKRAVSGKGVILKADVMGFAVCPYPKNPETLTGILTKGFFSPEAEDAPKADLFSPDAKLRDSAMAFFDVLSKAVSTGYDIGGTTQEGAASTRRESLDGETYFDFDADSIEKKAKKLSKDKKAALKAISCDAKRRGNKVTKGEAAFIFSLLGYPLGLCVDIVGRD